MKSTNHTCLFTATGTPLNSDERLHQEGLRRHLDDQWNAGIDGVLVGGSMGMMQMLRDETYRDLIQKSVECSHDCGEVLVGVGDVGFARTRDRIELACRYRIDGVVAVAPYFFRFPQDQMVDYFRALADISRVPLYLYDLPVRTGVEIDISTYETLAEHPNIRGAKISGRIDVARELLRRFDSNQQFRIIVAEPQIIVDLEQEGFRNHLDGIFAIAPHWFVELALAVDAGDCPQALACQSRNNRLLELLRSSRSLQGAFTAMMNARGLPGNYHAAPAPALTDGERAELLATSIMEELLTKPSCRQTA